MNGWFASLRDEHFHYYDGWDEGRYEALCGATPAPYDPNIPPRDDLTLQRRCPKCLAVARERDGLRE